MPKLPGVNHLRAVKALEKAGFHIDRQGKHIFLSKGSVRVLRRAIIPSTPTPWPQLSVTPGLTIEQFKDLL
jgi:predicted RNA binding protein YcfA (HicA-like mRNA interferase family)